MLIIRISKKKKSVLVGLILFDDLNLKQKTIAHWVAMNEITRLKLEKEWPGKGDTKGSSQMAGTEWYWTRSVNETEDKNSRQVEFKIYLDENRESSLTRLVVFLSRPEETSTPLP